MYDYKIEVYTHDGAGLRAEQVVLAEREFQAESFRDAERKGQAALDALAMEEVDLLTSPYGEEIHVSLLNKDRDLGGQDRWFHCAGARLVLPKARV
jgi:hypothetical protein